MVAGQHMNCSTFSMHSHKATPLLSTAEGAKKVRQLRPAGAQCMLKAAPERALKAAQMPVNAGKSGPHSTPHASPHIFATQVSPAHQLRQ